MSILQQREISELKAEIERLELLLALAQARLSLARVRFIEVARLLKAAAPGDEANRGGPALRPEGKL